MIYVIAVAVVSVLFRILFQYRVLGAENLRQYKTNGRPFIVCANHRNILDPVFVVMAYGWGKKLSIMGKIELFRNPVLAYIFTSLGAFPVDRGKGDKTALEKGIRDINNGHGMLIFPEGTRGDSDKMAKLKSGALMIAAQTGADIIPVRLIYPTKTRQMKFFGKVIVNIGEPLMAEDLNLTSGSKAAMRVAKHTMEDAFDKLLNDYNESVGYIPPVEETEEVKTESVTAESVTESVTETTPTRTNLSDGE